MTTTSGKTPEAVGEGREVFWPRALKLKPDGNVPVRINHVKTRDVGLVRELSDVKDRDGRWVIAHCTLDEPLDWIREGTPASMSWCNLGTRQPMPGGWTRHISGMVTEVSLLTTGHEPYEPAAQIWSIQRTPPTPKPEPTDEVITSPPVVYRHRPVNHRAQAEDAELRRRLDWLDTNGYRVDMETVIAGMQRDIAGGPTIHDLAREHRLLGVR